MEHAITYREVSLLDFFYSRTDEVFQKVADDFSSCALEFMQGGNVFHKINI